MNKPYQDLKCVDNCGHLECGATGNLPCPGRTSNGTNMCASYFHGLCLEGAQRDRELVHTVKQYVLAQETGGQNPRLLGEAVQGLLGTAWALELEIHDE